MTYGGALPNELANGVYLDLIPGFIAHKDNQGFLEEGVHYRMVDSKTANTAIGAGVGVAGGAAVGAGIGSLFGGVGAVPGAIVGGIVGGIAGALVGNSAEAEKVKEYIAPKTATEAKTMYWELGATGRDKFDKEAGINHYANPEIGEAYSMVTEADMPGYKRTGPLTWNDHWAGVVMKDGGDNVTLENFAVRDDDRDGYVNGVKQGLYIDRDWNFDMYGTKDKSQTFHKDHLDSNTHGNRATSIRVRTDK